MGCGGSKQQDVATGNTVSAGKLFRKEAAASESKASSTTTDATSADDGSLNSTVDTAEIAEVNGSLEGDEKSTTLTVVKVVEEEQLATNETPDEYLSPRKDGEMVEGEAGGEEADHVLPSKVHDAANGVEGNGMGKELKESETKAEKEEEGRSLA